MHAYLSAGNWANPGLSNGLKLARRWWIGPVELPLARLVRKCGPEPEMKYRMPADQWNERTGRIASTVSDPAQL
ncbi:MAG: hypothetical protein J0I57_21850, partial [Hyphomicrobium sp.]|nr:hypothetical protein [Hyphomicrobium sp.]